MGVPIFCCSKNRKEEEFSEEPSILVAGKIENKLDQGLTNKNTNNSGTIRNFNTLKKKNDSINNSKYKPSFRNVSIKETNSLKQTILSKLSKKCTYDQKVLKNQIQSKSKIKYSDTLFIPEKNKRISHRIDIDWIIKNNKEEFKEKENNIIINNKQESNKHINNIIEKRRKSIMNIMSLGNVNELKIKEKEMVEVNINHINDSISKEENNKNDNNIITKDNMDNNNKIEKIDDTYNFDVIKENPELELVLNPIMNEESEEEDKINNANKQNDTVEILYYNELKNIKSIPRPKINTLPIEVIHEPFTKRQLSNLKKILIQEELIIDEMDEKTIQEIIDSVEYIKVKKGINIYTRKDKVENIYYMLDKGEVEYNIDKDKYLLPVHCGIGTNALYTNSKNSCSLKSNEKSFLFKLSIEKYKIIVRNFFEELHDLKLRFLSRNFFFSGLKKKFDKIIDCFIKIKYENKTILVEQDEINRNIYIIIEGHITCSKNNEVIKKLNSNEMFGEIGIYNSDISLYEYAAEANTTILTISFEDLFNCIGNDAPKIIMQKIFEKAVKENESLSKYFLAGENLTKIFNLSQIKYYFNDIVCGNKEKKIFIPVSGSVFKIIPLNFLDNGVSEHLVNHHIKKLYLDNYESMILSKLDSNLYKERKMYNRKFILVNGKLNIDLITVNGNSKYYILGDECLIIEINWIDIEKNIVIPNKETQLTLNQRINLIKSIQFFKNLTPLQTFKLSNYVHLQQYKFGEIILENGPISNTLYLIKNGTVQIKIGDVIIQTLEQGQTFGEFKTYEKITKKANYIAANKNVECYFIEKENYEDITEKEFISPLKKYLTKDSNKKIKNYLNKLYYMKDLGSGSYGKVYLVHDEKNFYAMKTANIYQMNEMKESAKIYINEKNIMFSMKHPFIVSIIDTFKTKDFLFFLLEYIDGINLQKYLSDSKRELRNLIEVKFFLGTMALVLNYLQNHRIIHRDLKPANIMIDYKGYFKVIDFGIAIDITGKDYACSTIGTFHYMAPEVIRGENYNNAIDYWSVGIIAYELFYGRLPFGQGEKNPLNIYRDILEKRLYLPSENEVGFNEVVYDLLRKNSKKRLNKFSQWKNYKLFNGFDFDKLLGLKMKGYYDINKSLNTEDLLNKKIPFIDYMKNNMCCNKNDNEIIVRNKHYELFEDF